MNKSRKQFTVAEAKIKASILLKSLYGTSPEQSVKRFQRLPEFAGCSVVELLSHDVKHKHALAVIALENGCNSWSDLKLQLDFIVGGYLNLWFATYAEAKTHLQSEGGFLLPYKNQFFICNATYMKQIGFDPDDPDWKRIGSDWVQPSNQIAWQRLYKKWKAAKQDSKK